MSQIVLPQSQISYLSDGVSLRSWLLTTDHKRIAILYMISITFFFFLGGSAAALIRYNLLVPQGLLVDAEAYNRTFTLHGVLMVWLFLVPSIPTTFGNFLLPLMLGAKDLAFPRLNLLSWYLFVLSGLIVLGGFIPSIVKVVTTISYKQNITTTTKTGASQTVTQNVNVQDQLDAILPFMLPVAVTALVYVMLRKFNLNPIWAIAALFAVGLALGWTGWFAPELQGAK